MISLSSWYSSVLGTRGFASGIPRKKGDGRRDGGLMCGEVSDGGVWMGVLEATLASSGMLREARVEFLIIHARHKIGKRNRWLGLS